MVPLSLGQFVKQRLWSCSARERLTTRGETNLDLQIDSPRLFNYSRLIVIASRVLQVSLAFENEKQNYSVYESRSRFGEKEKLTKGLMNNEL